MSIWWCLEQDCIHDKVTGRFTTVFVRCDGGNGSGQYWSLGRHPPFEWSQTGEDEGTARKTRAKKIINPIRCTDLGISFGAHLLVDSEWLLFYDCLRSVPSHSGPSRLANQNTRDAPVFFLSFFPFVSLFSVQFSSHPSSVLDGWKRNPHLAQEFVLLTSLRKIIFFSIITHPLHRYTFPQTLFST